MLRSRVQSGNRVQSEQLEALRLLILDVGGPVWVFGPTAAALHAFDNFFLQPPFHLLVDRGRNISRIGNVVHTTKYLEPIDREEALGFAVTAPARTIIDLVRFEPAQRVTTALDSALRDGGTTETHLHARIAALRTKGRHGVPALLRIIEGSEITRGGHSWLERRFLELTATAGLPKPECQVILTKSKNKIVRVDFRFRHTRLVVEVLGYNTHRTRDQLSRDSERVNQLTLAGYLVLQFTYLHVTEEPDWVIDQIREAFRVSPPALRFDAPALTQSF